MKVYRYLRAEHALRALQTRKWKLGRLPELNDPFDCQPVLENAPVLSSPEETLAFTRDYLSALRLDTGLISYSRRIDDPVIWSHYADSHRGIALAFDYGENDGLIEVVYSEHRAKIDYVHVEELRSRDENEAIRDVISRGFTVKAPSWKYECEYRHFVNLWTSGCEMEGLHYFLPIPQMALKAVILGARCSVEIEDIKRVVARWPSWDGVTVTRAVADPIAYRINA